MFFEFGVVGSLPDHVTRESIKAIAISARQAVFEDLATTAWGLGIRCMV